MSKYCNFAFLLYPESCNSNFVSILENLNTPVYYILHDKDTIIDENGKIVPKKPHYHVMIIFANPRSENTGKEICLQCGGNGHLKKIISRQGYARYLMHLDEEFKYHYNRSEVITINDNFEKKYDDIISIDNHTNKQNEILAEILQYAKRNRLIAYCQLVDYCVAERLDWLPIVRKNSHMIYTYLKSLNWYNSLN